MAKLECPICGNTFTKSMLNAWTEDICSNCYRNPERRQQFIELNAKPVRDSHNKKVETYDSQLSELSKAADQVIKFSKVFKKIGDILNTINYVATTILIIFVFIAIFSNQIDGLYILFAVLIILVLWALAWVQTGLLRGVSAFFLMKGLRQKIDLE
jgi:hypothetical protein